MASKKALLSKKIDKAIFEFELIKPGDKILLAVSGGKDSLTMAYFLGKKQGKFPIAYETEAIYIQSDFEGCGASPDMKRLLDEWNIPLTVLDVPIVERLKPGMKLNCYWCSTQRRMELLRYADKYGFNKIALGHHMDDIIETFLMNMIFKSELSTMLPSMKYDKYPQTVIRPLARVQEHEIINFISNAGYAKSAVTCPYGRTSKRLAVRSLIDRLAECEGNGVRERIFNSMKNVKMDYLLGGSSIKD